MLVDPTRRLIEEWPQAKHTIQFVHSHFGQDFRTFIHEEVMRFCKPHNHFFETQYHAIRRRLRQMDQVFVNLAEDNSGDAKQVFHDVLLETQAFIRAIPCDDPGTILPSESPFQTYIRLRAVCAGVSSGLDVLDPYLSADVFHRYLADVPPSAMLTVVTSDKVMMPSRPQDIPRRDRIVAVSELVALERKGKYRFLVTAQQHDRHCRADNDILHLGGSVAHAGIKDPYTLSKLDPSQSNHAFLDGVIAAATEWYGPTVTTHRKA
jgi:hypothetical protein